MPSQQRDRWIGRINALIESVRGWVQNEDWVTKRHPKKMRDAGGDVYEAPSLFLQRGATRLLLDPIAYDVPGSEGVVDLYLMPTYDDTATLSWVDGGWQIRYALHDAPVVAGVKQVEVMELSKRSINRVLDEIAAHAVPSV